MDTFKNLCRLRSTLEAFAALRLHEQPPAQRAAALDRIRARLDPLRACARKGNYEAFHRADMDLHRALVASCEVPTLLDSWEAAARALDATILQVKKKHWPSLMALYREHIYLIDAWASHDATIVGQATRQHLEVGWYRMEMVRGRMPDEGSAVDRAASFLSTHHASEIDIAWIAQNIAFLSASQLTRRFHEQFGMAPYAWLRQVRMERASQLLSATQDDVAEVGRKVGYKNASHFTRDFRARFGVAPRRWRSGKQHS